MAGFESALQSASLAILKRELEEDEKIEFLELAGAIGMNNVQDYLYMLMVFKRNEDRVTDTVSAFQTEIRERFEEISALEKKIDQTLENSINRILVDGAQKIGKNLGEKIGEEAQYTLSAHKEFHFLRGQLLVVGLISFLLVVAYSMGAVYGVGNGHKSFIDAFLQLPAGHVTLVCGSAYTALWGLDYWWHIKNNTLYKVKLVMQILVLAALAFRMF